MPDFGMTRKFSLGGGEGPGCDPEMTIYVIIQRENGKPAAIFFAGQKAGSMESGLLRLLAMSLTELLRRGVAIQEIAAMLRNHDFGPQGFVDFGGQNRPVRSMADAIGRWLEGIQ